MAGGAAGRPLLATRVSSQPREARCSGAAPWPRSRPNEIAALLGQYLRLPRLICRWSRALLQRAPRHRRCAAPVSRTPVAQCVPTALPALSHRCEQSASLPRREARCAALTRHPRLLARTRERAARRTATPPPVPAFVQPGTPSRPVQLDRVGRATGGRAHTGLATSLATRGRRGSLQDPLARAAGVAQSRFPFPVTGP